MIYIAKFKKKSMMRVKDNYCNCPITGITIILINDYLLEALIKHLAAFKRF